MITIAIPADKFHYFSEPISTYLERLSNVKIHALPICKTQDAGRAITQETQDAREWLEKRKEYTIFLHETGKKMTSMVFAQKIEKWQQEHGNIRFLIGGSYGFDLEKITPCVQEKISLGDMTLPHALACTVLLEQIYRAAQIKKGTHYHH